MDARFEQGLSRLASYRDKHGHCYVWRDSSENDELRAWLDEQLRAAKKGQLAGEKLSALKALGADLEAVGAHWERWESRYLELVEFVRINGHADVSQLVPGLGPWLSAQRVLHRQDQLAPQRQSLLEEIGVEWQPSERKKERWIERFYRLRELKEINGHCNVSRRKQPDPGVWVSAQRTAHRKAVLSPERVLLLESIGFEWSLKGDTPPPPDMDKDPWIRQFLAARHCGEPLPEPLQHWLSRQIQLAENGELSPERGELVAILRQERGLQ